MTRQLSCRGICHFFDNIIPDNEVTLNLLWNLNYNGKSFMKWAPGQDLKELLCKQLFSELWSSFMCRLTHEFGKLWCQNCKSSLTLINDTRATAVIILTHDFKYFQCHRNQSNNIIEKVSINIITQLKKFYQWHIWECIYDDCGILPWIS